MATQVRRIVWKCGNGHIVWAECIPADELADPPLMHLACIFAGCTNPGPVKQPSEILTLP